MAQEYNGLVSNSHGASVQHQKTPLENQGPQGVAQQIGTKVFLGYPGQWINKDAAAVRNGKGAYSGKSIIGFFIRSPGGDWGMSACRPWAFQPAVPNSNVVTSPPLSAKAPEKWISERTTKPKAW